MRIIQIFFRWGGPWPLGHFSFLRWGGVAYFHENLNIVPIRFCRAILTLSSIWLLSVSNITILTVARWVGRGEWSRDSWVDEGVVAKPGNAPPVAPSSRRPCFKQSKNKLAVLRVLRLIDLVLNGISAQKGYLMPLKVIIIRLLFWYKV